MDTHAIAKEIVSIKNQLAAIEADKQDNANGGLAADVERQEAALRERMAQLQAELATGGTGNDRPRTQSEVQPVSPG